MPLCSKIFAVLQTALFIVDFGGNFKFKLLTVQNTNRNKLCTVLFSVKCSFFFRMANLWLRNARGPLKFLSLQQTKFYVHKILTILRE